MQDHSCSQRFLRVNIDSTAEHSRSSGVFSRRRVAVNGSAAALPESLLCVELFLAGGERLRQMTPCDGWRPLQGVERRLAVRASLVGGALRKSANRRVARPRVFFAAETTSVGGDDLAFSLLSVCPPKRLGASLVRHTGCISRIFLANHLHYLSRHLLLPPDHYLPFLQPSKNGRFG